MMTSFLQCSPHCCSGWPVGSMCVSVGPQAPISDTLRFMKNKAPKRALKSDCMNSFVTRMHQRYSMCKGHAHVLCVTSWPVTLVRAISISSLLIFRLCACVLRYVSAGWEIERNESREAITLLLLLLFHYNLNYNYRARYLQQHQTLPLRTTVFVSGSKTSCNLLLRLGMI